MTPIKLHDFQNKIVDCVIKNLKKRDRSLIVVPTGGGKTVIFCEIANRLNLKTLFLAHTRELLEQAKRTFKIMGIEDGLITFDSIQRITHPSNKIPENVHFDLVVIDECHRARSNSYMKIINRFFDSKIIGLTATPYRGDGQLITNIFGYPEEPLTLIDLIKSGFLCDFIGHRIKTSINLQSIKRTNSTKDFSSGCLSAVINVKERNEIILNAWRKYGENKKTLGFACSVPHAIELCNIFRQNGIPSDYISGSIATSERDIRIMKFKSGETKVMWNCDILTEGFDEPSIECLLMARPTLSKRLYVQMIGRGSRIFPEKKYCKVLEFTDNQYDVCNLKDLLKMGTENIKLIEGESLTKMIERVEVDLLDSDGQIVEENQKIVEEVFDPPASDALLNILKNFGIFYKKNITEFGANLLLSNHLQNLKGTK